LSAVQSNNNTWTGTNIFNTSLPTSTVTPTTSTQLITKSYADSTYTTLSNVLSNNNAFTGTCTFNTNLPTSTITPTTSTQLITKSYADANYSASGATTLSNVLSNNNVWTGSNSFNTTLPTSTATPSSSTQLVTKTYVDTQVATKQNILSNASFLDSTSSTQTQLNTINTTISNLQPLISGTTNLSIANLQLNTSSSSTPVLQLYGYGGSGSSVSINLDTYYRSTPATTISAIDNGNSSSDLVFYTTTQGSQSTIKSERMRIYASGAINMTGLLSCNNLNFNTGSLYSDGTEMWIYNNNLSYGSNFALFQSNTGNTIINASSGQSIYFKINNNTNGYMQMYPNGVVNIGCNQVYNKQLVLYDTNSGDSPSSATVFYGFGINSNTLRYQVDTINSSHIFYGGSTNYATISYSGITSSGQIVSSNNIMFTANVYT
jgi:hypothetical protein